ncbi:unnamed protein product [Effrenium voratum]|uniref:Uncharacterized protein n=1 Tax=Effrenium voratum TaxID=2562239 RepID=A0AA36IFJ6_9DINO|nr:unnamed protein product [Effrenium voratum]|mmetsp:Transcript_126633/g.300861  ORF Transcript_126633/g.300861 Transcript_126633/m.300861 type:complete len:281 (-) Transcript_126633:91-933(-)
MALSLTFAQSATSSAPGKGAPVPLAGHVRHNKPSTCAMSLLTSVAALGLGICARNLRNKQHHKRLRFQNEPSRLKMRAEDVVGRAGLFRSLKWSIGGLLGRRKSGGTATLEKGESDMATSPEEEFARLTNPEQNVAILGTRDCAYPHQQEIEALTQGHVEREHRIFTSGSTGTNSAVIKAVLDKGRPDLLTVELPQSFGKQDDDVQALLNQCKEGGATIRSHRERDHIELAQAAAECNTRILNQVNRLVVFATDRSDKYLRLVREAQSRGVVVAAFNVEV